MLKLHSRGGLRASVTSHSACRRSLFERLRLMGTVPATDLHEWGRSLELGE
jgi:hypothetical protein